MSTFSPLPGYTLPVQTTASVRFNGLKATKAIEIPEPEDKQRPFYAAKPNRLVIGTMKHAGCAITRLLGMTVTATEADKAKLRKSQGDPDNFHIHTANHSSDLDILTLGELTRQAGTHFIAMGAVEIFEPELMGRKWPIVGKVLQRCGVFSVDRESKNKSRTLDAAREMLKKGEFPFALFPEGYVTFTNMVVEPLKNGAARIGINVVHETGKDVLITPISFYFHNRNDITPILKDMLDKIEAEVADRLKITLSAQDSMVDRIKTLGRILVAERETHYKEKYPGIKTLAETGKTGDNTIERLEYMREQVLTHLEHKYLTEEEAAELNPAQLELFPKLAAKGTHEIRARRLIGYIRRQQISRENLNGLLETMEEERQHFLKRKPDEKIKNLLRNTYDQLKTELKALGAQNTVYQEDIATLKQIMNLTMYPRNYLRDDSQQTRLMETVPKLYRDVLGQSDAASKKIRLQLIRRAGVEACVHVSDPISVKQCMEEHPEPKTLADYITEKIRTGLQEGIEKKAAI